VRLDRESHVAVGRPRDQPHARDGRDAREPLASKPERRNPFEIFGASELARRVACEGEVQLIRCDSRAVVRNVDRIEAAARDRDDDSPRPGIERVFDQLLYHGERALDHLARRDLPDGRLVEKTYHPRPIRRVRRPLRATPAGCES
jgi:hypothetical protein